MNRRKSGGKDIFALAVPGQAKLSSTPLLPGYYSKRSEENGEKKRRDTATAGAHRVFHSMKQRHDSDAARATALGNKTRQNNNE